MEQELKNELTPMSDTVQLGSMQLSGPQDVIARAEQIATPLAKLINDRKLYNVIGGKKYVRVEGWSTLGAMLGILPREKWSKKLENGYETYVELVRGTDGQVIGGASAICTRDEKNWADRDEYALKSMSNTRATSKAYRIAFSWIINLAGYESTPAEEMIDAEFVEQPPRKKTVKNGELNTPMSLEMAEATKGSDGVEYGDCDDETLAKKMMGISKALNNKNLTPEQRETYLYKRDAILTIQAYRKLEE